MSSKKETTSPQGQAVDFLIRTMIERESGSGRGKRIIKPKNIDEPIFGFEDSDEDPDFSIKEASSNSDTDGDIDDSDNSSNDDDSNSDSDESSDGDSDDSDDDNEKGASTLRKVFKKFDDDTNAYQNSKAKKKRKKKKPAINKSKTGGSNDNDKEFSLNDESGGKKKPPPKKKPKNVKDSKGGKKGKTKEVEVVKNRKPKRTTAGLINTVNDHLDENRKLQAQDVEMKKELICSVCLGIKSDASNEIVECDSCGVTVHEACYAISDTHSIGSGTGSSFSTEPWFCDFCRRGVKFVHCQLCPLLDGLFKETKQGQWVHLVCALYTQGIILGDDHIPDLNEINYTKWGVYTCALCDDDRLAKTGICIPCDAGLCKTYLHATCAQKYGLLSDPDPENMHYGDDPYYVSCKLHSHKEIASKRAKIFQRLQERLRIRQEQKKSENLSEKEKELQSRILRKLEKFRSRMDIGNKSYSTSTNLDSFHLEEENITPFYSSEGVKDQLNDQKLKKKGRYLQSSPSACIFFNKKVDCIGLDSKSKELQEQSIRIIENIHKRWSVPPQLNVIFASYYADRELRIKNLTESCTQLHNDSMGLTEQEEALQTSWETTLMNNHAMTEENDRIQNKIDDFKDMCRSLSMNPRLFKDKGDNKRASSTSPKRKKSAKSRENSPLSKPKKQSLPAGVNANKRKKERSMSSTSEKKAKFFSLRSPLAKERLCLMQCSVCDKTDLQHLITRCDECSKTFHIGCLDPPLTKMPKKTKLQGWMCSDCHENDTNPKSDEEKVDTEAPRNLRGRTSIKKPGKYRASSEETMFDPNEVISTTKSKKKSPETSLEKVKQPTENGNILTAKPLKNGFDNIEKLLPWADQAPSYLPLNSFSEEGEGKCATCSKIDSRNMLVLCDRCNLEFHFCCLSPPLKYTPKRRGYSWFCKSCEDLTSLDSDHEGPEITTNGLAHQI